MAKVKSSTTRPRRKMVRTTEEVRRWSALLAEEIVSWPKVSVKHMFGFLSYYRGNVLFAILPRTRGFESGRLLILKFVPMSAKLLHRAQSDPRLGTDTRNPGRGWFTFELGAEEDLHDALWWLQQAFACAGNRGARERVNRPANSSRRKSHDTR
jgi:hypothetical protein